jgi:GNAT superfamily N-acetyltransferase
MTYRVAKVEDFEAIHLVRNAVTENTLSDPGLITQNDYALYLTTRGKGWVCEIDNQIVGFSIVDLNENNVWALFLLPGFERRGIGRRLQKLLLDWYFEQTKETIWLGTTPDTRAEIFYRKSGWKEVGMYGEDEIKFEMTYGKWLE